jgi:hypothetical protein
MNAIKIIVIGLAGCIVASIAVADIYEWTDENGVKHYSNYAPPPGSRVLMKTKEEPYDEAADRARMEAERRERLEMERLEIARREVALELREAEAERRLAEADRLAQEALRDADDDREEARYGSRVVYGGGLWGGRYWCRDSRWDCRYPVPYRWSEREKYNNYHYRKRHHRTPYQQYLYVKKLYGPRKHHKKDSGHRYHNNIRHRHDGKYSNHKYNSHLTTTNYRANRIGTRSGRMNGHGNLSRGRSGFGMRR